MPTIDSTMELISKPLKDKNAIEAATFAVVLAVGFDADALARMDRACDALVQELPGKEQLQFPAMFAMAPGANFAGGPSIQNHGFIRMLAKPDATLAWRFQVTGNMLGVTCFDYTNWDEIWPKACRFLTTALEAAEVAMPVAEVGYQVVDKFVYQENDGESLYSPFEVFNKDSIYLTDKVGQAGPLWHVHQGWFEATSGLPSEQAKTLHQLNLSNTEEQLVGKRFASVIDHRGAVRFVPGATTLPELLVPDEQTGGNLLSTLFVQLHHKNVQIMSELLTQEKLDSIGIEAPEV